MVEKLSRPVSLESPTLRLRSTSELLYPFKITFREKEKMIIAHKNGRSQMGVAIEILTEDVLYLGHLIGTIAEQKIQNNMINDDGVAEDLHQDRKFIEGYQEVVSKLGFVEQSSALSPIEQAEEIIFRKSSSPSQEAATLGSDILNEELERRVKQLENEGKDPMQNPFLNGFRAGFNRYEMLNAFIQQNLPK